MLISSFRRKSLDETDEALRNGATCLFEPAFLYDDILVRCDILHKRDDGAWDIIEVKSSTQVKPYHVEDLSVQRYVLEGSGMRIGAVKLMHINSRECVYPDLSNLFAIEDVTDKVDAQRGAVRRQPQGHARRVAPQTGTGHLHWDAPR